MAKPETWTITNLERSIRRFPSGREIPDTSEGRPPGSTRVQVAPEELVVGMSTDTDQFLLANGVVRGPFCPSPSVQIDSRDWSRLLPASQRAIHALVDAGLFQVDHPLPDAPPAPKLASWSWDDEATP
jgi:hypothetical protein